jgi:hypothetical protein
MSSQQHQISLGSLSPDLQCPGGGPITLQGGVQYDPMSQGMPCQGAVQPPGGLAGVAANGHWTFGADLRPPRLYSPLVHSVDDALKLYRAEIITIRQLLQLIFPYLSDDEIESMISERVVSTILGDSNDAARSDSKQECT